MNGDFCRFQQYQINIQDARQPLLVILPTARDKRRGQTTHILLIPELSILTGVSEAMRTDFRFKKALDQFAKVDAGTRCNRLQDFVARFKTQPQVKGELDKWRMDFSNRPLELNARAYPPETLGFGDVSSLSLRLSLSFLKDRCRIEQLSVTLSYRTSSKS